MTGKSLTVAAIALAMMLSAHSADAQRHNGASRGKEKTEQTRKSSNSSRPGRTDRGSSDSTNRNQQTRPSSQKKKEDKATTRPGRNQKVTGNQNNNNNRPSNNGYRPGNNNNNNNNNNRPNNNGYRPGNTNPGNHKPNVRPPYNQTPNHSPAAAPAPTPKPTPTRHPVALRQSALRPSMIVPPVRPYRPPVRPWRRPTPPPAWRPWHGPSLAGILGLTFGTAIGVSLDYLYGNNYFVDGYSDDVVYLRNVNEMNYVWPDATLYYGPGGLTGSQFSYSTTYRDMTRYNNLYMQLVNRYGRPVGYTSVGGTLDATWFGPDNGFIRLQFNAMNPGSGTRFYTTLEFGN